MHHETDEINLIDIYRFLLSERLTILIITGAAAALSVVVALQSPVIYTAQVVVAPSAEDSRISGAAALLQQFGMGGTTGQDTQQALAFLQSRALVESFIRDNDLLPVLYADQWDAGAGRWKNSKDSAPTIWKATRFFSRGVVAVNHDRRNNGLITVTVEWHDPVVAAEWANGLVKLADDTLRQQALRDTEQSIGYLTQQAGQTSIVGVQQAIFNLIENEMKTASLARSRTNYAFAVIDPAVPPELRSRPKRTQMVLMGTFLGGFLALLFVGARRFWHTLRSQATEETT